MKRLLFNVTLVTLFGVVYFFASCNQSNNPSKNDCNYCDTSIYELVYQKNGFVLLKEKKPATALDGSKENFLFDNRVPIETARGYVTHYNTNFRLGRLTASNFVDFKYDTIFQILKNIKSAQSGFDTKRGGLRIYFGAYPNDQVDAGRTVAYKNNMTTILVGTYDETDVTDYYNLGHLCPPNCYGTNTGTVDATKSKLFQ